MDTISRNSRNLISPVSVAMNTSHIRSAKGFICRRGERKRGQSKRKRRAKGEGERNIRAFKVQLRMGNCITQVLKRTPEKELCYVFGLREQEWPTGGSHL